MLYRLIQRPELMQRLRVDPALIPIAIEEALRFEQPAQGLFHANSEECTVHGVTIPEGSKLQVLFASANHDPARFDRPDEFDINQPQKEAPLGTWRSAGEMHHCIGAPLAAGDQGVPQEILRRMGDIELVGTPTRNDSFVLHGLASLPLRWRSSHEPARPFRLDGKVAVVTGSGQGIGRAIAWALADAGADIVINARRIADCEAAAAGVERVAAGH